jgi:hypothetical protein
MIEGKYMNTKVYYLMIVWLFVVLNLTAVPDYSDIAIQVKDLHQLQNYIISPNGAEFLSELPPEKTKSDMLISPNKGSFEAQIKALAFNLTLPMKHDMKCDSIRFTSFNDDSAGLSNMESLSSANEYHVVIWGDMTDPYTSYSYVYNTFFDDAIYSFNTRYLQRGFLIRITMILDENNHIVAYKKAFEETNQKYQFSYKSSLQWEFINESEAPIYSDVMIESVDFEPGFFVIGVKEKVTFTIANFGPLKQSAVMVMYGMHYKDLDTFTELDSLVTELSQYVVDPPITFKKKNPDSETKVIMMKPFPLILDFAPWDSVDFEFYIMYNEIPDQGANPQLFLNAEQFYYDKSQFE